MNILSALPLKSLLNSQKIRNKIAAVVVSMLEKNMGKADFVKVVQVEGEIVVMGAKNEGEIWQYWRIENKDFFNIGLPIDLSKQLAKFAPNAAKADFSTGCAIISRTETGLNLMLKDGETVEFSGDLHAACEDFIKNNAEAIASDKVAGQIEIPTENVGD